MNILEPETWPGRVHFAVGAILIGPSSFCVASMLSNRPAVTISATFAGMILGGVVAVSLREHFIEVWRRWW